MMKEPYPTRNRLTVFGRVEECGYVQRGDDHYLNLTLDITPSGTSPDGGLRTFGEQLLLSTTVLGAPAAEWAKSLKRGDMVSVEGVLTRVVKPGDVQDRREFVDLRQAVVLGHVPGEWVEEWEAGNVA